MAPRKAPMNSATRYTTVAVKVTGTPGAYSAAPLAHSPRVTAGLRWVPELAPAKTPAETPRPPPKVVSSQPPPLPRVWGSTTFATTPTPSKISIAVPTTSLPNTVHRLMRCSSSPVMRGCHGLGAGPRDGRSTTGSGTLFTQVEGGQRVLYDDVGQRDPASGAFAPGDAQPHGAFPLRIGGVESGHPPGVGHPLRGAVPVASQRPGVRPHPHSQPGRVRRAEAHRLPHHRAHHWAAEHVGQELHE